MGSSAIVDRITALLERTAPFDRLRPEERRQLLCEVLVEYFEPDEVILEQGRTAHEFLYIVESGFVRLLNPQTQRLDGECGEGRVFGGHGLVEGGALPYEARTVEPTVCVLLRAGRFRELYSAHKGFAALDALVGRLALRSLRGETSFRAEGFDDARATGRSATLHLSGLNDEERRVLDDLFSLEKQRARGSWSSRSEIEGRLGRLQFPHHLMEHGRFFHTSVESDAYRSVSAEASPEAPLAHTVLDPMFSSLYEPFVLRSGRAFPPSFDDSPEKAESSRERRRTRWQEVDIFFAALDLGVEPELSVLKPGEGWSRLRAAEQLSAKVALADAIRRGAERVGPASLGTRYRAFRLLPLLRRYYAKAKKDGRVLRRRSLTREFEATLSGFFGGDWLALLDYLGEEAHPDEHVATALPETRLYLGPSREAAAKLGAEGVSEEQLKLIAASLFGGETSPVERCLSVLARYWEAFDSLHARQESSMEPLWGLVEEYPGFVLFRAEEDDSPHRQGLYRRALPADLLDEIDELWGSAMSTREPARIVTEPFPHVRLAATFGPALRFWHGCALTTWFLCEGPYSRTDMAGLENYRSRALAELEDLGAPVDRSMFAEHATATFTLQRYTHHYDTSTRRTADAMDYILPDEP